jgi:hypothetical protein
LLLVSSLPSSTSRDSGGEVRLTELDLLYIDPNQAAIALTRLQNPVKASFNAINDSLKETHGGLNKYTKSLDKVLTYKALSA